MALFQIPTPDLASVSVGIPTLQFLNALGFSDDGRLLLVQATFTDSFDPNGSDLRYAVWVYDVVAGQYTISLNALVAESAGALRETDVLSARFAGGSPSQPNIIVHTALDDVEQSERLLMVSGQNTPVNIIATVLGADVRPSIQAYSVSTNGRFVALQTDSTFFSALDTNSTSDIYLLDLQSNAIERVSLLAGAETFKPISLGFVETNGATVSVSFTTEAGFSRADTNESLSIAEARVDAYTWSREFGANGFVGTPTFTLLSQALNRSASGLVLTDIGPVLTSVGSFFSSSSSNLVANDTNSQPDIFVSLPNGGVSRINLPNQSEWTSGAQLAGATDNGRILAVLTSSAEVAGPERNQQLVLLDQATKKYVVASSGAAGVGNDMVVTALISPKGDAAAFVSLATNLTNQPSATFGGSLFLVTGLADALDNEAIGTVSVSGTVAEGGTVSASVSVTDVDGGIADTSYQWQISSNGTSGWSDITGATTASYAIASDQSQVGKYLRVVAITTDALGGTTTFTSAATTAVANVNDAPVVSAEIAAQTNTEDTAWSYTVPAGTFSDADGDALTYTAKLANGDALPTWLSFNATTCTFNGTPPPNFNGDISLTVTASDGSASVSDTFVLTVTAQVQIVTGTSGNDALSGISGSISEIRGGAGNDTITGGNRADVALFSGNRADYTITTVAGVTTVKDNRAGSPDGTDTLRGLNILRFADIQLFQSAAANKMILAGQAQTYFVSNSEVVQGTNAAERFIVAPSTSALIFAGNTDVVDLSGSIGSYSFVKAGTQLQISDGVYTTTLVVGGSFTLRTASGSTTVAIDFTTPGGAIKLGGTQIVGSTTFDPLLAITDRSNYSQNAIQKDVIVSNGGSYIARDNATDVFVIDASKSLAVTISGFDDGDRIIFTNRTSAEGALFDAGVIGDGVSTITAGNASITLTSFTNDNFGNEAAFEAIYGANAIGYVL
jgi:hypothetical protein